MIKSKPAARRNFLGTLGPTPVPFDRSGCRVPGAIDGWRIIGALAAP